MYEIQKGVPIPSLKQARPPVFRKYKFDQMDVGDFFFVPGHKKNTMGTHAAAIGKKLGMKFITRALTMHRTKEGWVICQAEDTGATAGVGVWRVEGDPSADEDSPGLFDGSEPEDD
jgi:hypothetical protein